MELDRQQNLDIIRQVDVLSEQVKELALQVAIYLAKAKGASEELHRLEPEFIKLVNGTVQVVQEIAIILNAANNLEKIVYDVPSGRISKDHIEIRLHYILDQCLKIKNSLSKSVDIDG